jgi:hypothetical protein
MVEEKPEFKLESESMRGIGETRSSNGCNYSGMDSPGWLEVLMGREEEEYQKKKDQRGKRETHGTYIVVRRRACNGGSTCAVAIFLPAVQLPNGRHNSDCTNYVWADCMA